MYQSSFFCAHPMKLKPSQPSFFSLPCIAVATLLAAGCQTIMDDKKPIIAIAEIKPTTSATSAKLSPTGLVTLTQVEGHKVLVKAAISGLKPFAEHGFHVHAVPDCSGDALGTGGHFNPDAHPHGDPAHILRHAGAMFNVKADAQGVATTRQELDTVMLSAGRYSIVGLPIIVHRDPDDYVSQPLGNAGPRVGCGVITVQETAAKK
jgi:superoxide dismutase, Cu-Zn family